MAPRTVLEARWTSWIVEEARADGQFAESRVVVLLKLHREDAKSALQKMQRAEDMGWPDARKMKANGQPAVVRPDKREPAIWELKTTPHPWRLYFYVAETERTFIYTHATYKTQTKQNPGDVVSARNVLLKLQNGDAKRKRLNLAW